MAGWENPPASVGYLSESVDGRPANSYDLQTPARSKVDLRRTPQLWRQSLQIVWQAARGRIPADVVEQYDAAKGEG